jgi:hypothetical protein
MERMASIYIPVGYFGSYNLLSMLDEVSLGHSNSEEVEFLSRVYMCSDRGKNDCQSHSSA